MSYSTDLAKLLTGQLTKSATLNRHQLAGHVANLDFWLAEVAHSLAILDGYSGRFQRLKATQKHHALEGPPRRVPDAQLKEARRSLCNAAYRFLVRCHNDGLVEQATLQQACDHLGISIQASDLRRPT
jgi:hypothetical protein